MLQTSDSVCHVGVIPIAIARKRIPLAVFHEAISLHGLDTRDHHTACGRTKLERRWVAWRPMAGDSLQFTETTLKFQLIILNGRGENRDGAFAEIHWFRPPGVIMPERAGILEQPRQRIRFRAIPRWFPNSADAQSLARVHVTTCEQVGETLHFVSR